MLETNCHSHRGPVPHSFCSRLRCRCCSPARTRQASICSRLGLQLYSLRAQFAKDVPGTLDKVRDMGFKNVETAGTYGVAPAKFKKELKSLGLTIVSAHFPYEKFRDDVEGVASEAKALGAKYAGCAWIAHSGTFSEQGCREAAKVFNKAGEALAKHGIKFFLTTRTATNFQPYGSWRISSIC